MCGPLLVVAIPYKYNNIAVHHQEIFRQDILSLSFAHACPHSTPSPQRTTGASADNKNPQQIPFLLHSP